MLPGFSPFNKHRRTDNAKERPLKSLQRQTTRLMKVWYVRADATAEYAAMTWCFQMVTLLFLWRLSDDRRNVYCIVLQILFVPKVKSKLPSLKRLLYSSRHQSCHEKATTYSHVFFMMVKYLHVELE
jgi:hypothetical protein